MKCEDNTSKMYDFILRNSAYGAYGYKTHKTLTNYPQKITIHDPSFESWDCECCGWTSYGSFKVSIDNVTVNHDYDGHFGGGDWDGEDYGMYGLLLADLFDAHYTNIETDESIHSMGVREDLRGLYGVELEEFLKLSPNKVVDIKIFEAWDMAYNATIKFEDAFHLDIKLPFGMCHDDETDLDMDKAMKFIFEKVCECLGVVIEYT